MRLESRRTEAAPSPPAAMRETAYVRPAGYAKRYRDERFEQASGPRTHARELEALRDLLREAAAAGPWLDMPSGTGRLSGLLPPPVVRVDRDREMLTADGCGQRACASGVALPFADGAFRGALCLRLLQHIPTATERIALLAELRRVTTDSVIVSFFDAWSLQHARRIVRRWAARRRSARIALSPRQLREELFAAGLRVRRARPLLRFVSEQTLVLAEPR
jgi:hypothetical protein